MKMQMVHLMTVHIITAKTEILLVTFSIAQEIVYRLDTQAPAPPGDLDSRSFSSF